MTIRRFIYTSHKWLAVITGAFTFLWFFSAVAMLLPRDLLLRRTEPRTATEAVPALEPSRKMGSPFKEIAVSIPQAIDAVESAAGGETVTRTVRVDSFEGRLSYRIETEANGVWWVDTADGTVRTIDQGVARRLVLATGLAGDALATPEFFTEHGPDYSYGPLPAYRFTASGQGLTFIVDPTTGEVQVWSALRRWYRFITGWHTLDFLRPYLGGPVVGLLMWVLSIVGTGMTLFGLGILCLQFQQWRQGRLRARAVT